MDGDENASPAVGANEQPHPEPMLPDVDMLRYYRARRQFRFGRFLAPMRFPPRHDASYTLAMDNMLRLRESNFIFLGNGNSQPAPDPDNGGAAYRNGGFGAVPASEEAMAVLVK
ncbi:unnamed protein product [Urochloa humidicola]